MMKYKTAALNSTPVARSPADCFIALCITAFLIYAVLVLGWSGGKMLIVVWLQTLALWVLTIIAALVMSARAHWAFFLVTLLLLSLISIGFIQFIDLFGMFAWGIWGQEQGIIIQAPTFHSFRNATYFVGRITEVLPLWEVAVIVGLETIQALLLLLAPRTDATERFGNLESRLGDKIFVNHFAVVIGVALSTFLLDGSRAIILALLGLLFAINFFRLVRALRASFATSQ